MRAILLLSLLWAGSAAAQVPTGALPQVTSAPEILADTPTDYATPDHWLCRPDKADNPCRINLDATVLGTGTIERTPLPENPPIDCFYVYPTVSSEPTYFSDLVIEQVHRDIAAGQVARFSPLCKVYAPVYRQLTIPGLSWSSRNGFSRDDRNVRDVRAAFQRYLAEDNKGRGFVLIGHSQGARMVTALIREFVQAKPLHRQLIAAVLAGNGDDMFGAGGVLTVRPGRYVGGTFTMVPMCRAAGEAGCIIAWSSYADGYAGPRAFGNNDKAGNVGVCVNPASFTGEGAIAYLHTSIPPKIGTGAKTPFIKLDRQLTARCENDAAGAILRIGVKDGAPPVSTFLDAYSRGPVNLHMLDLALVQGNVVAAVAKAAESWRRRP